MRTLIVTAPANSDLDDIREYTKRRYGTKGADAYDRVLEQALRDLQKDPYRIGTKDRAEIASNIRCYHTSFSLASSGSSVKSSRHFVFYFVPNEKEVVISRVLHDSRDLERLIPEKHKEPTGNRSPRQRPDK
jgi:toxin ParE1/3/4